MSYIIYDHSSLTWTKDGSNISLNPAQHAFWQATSVFDGARYYNGCIPDLMRHCERVVKSAEIMQLKPDLSAQEIFDLCITGIKQFEPEAELYIKPMFYNVSEDMSILPKDGETRFAIQIKKERMPDLSESFWALVVDHWRKPSPETAPTEAKAGCLYQSAQLAKRFAKISGYHMAVMLNQARHVAEFASSNLFMSKNGIFYTPKLDGTFLNGITRQRVISLMRKNNIPIIEKVIWPEELIEADEVFSTGNYAKISFCSNVVYDGKSSRFESCNQTIKIFDLYRHWANTQTI